MKPNVNKMLIRNVLTTTGEESCPRNFLLVKVIKTSVFSKLQEASVSIYRGFFVCFSVWNVEKR